MAMLADLAFVFHWPPSELNELEVWELEQFHDLARERVKAMPRLF